MQSCGRRLHDDFRVLRPGALNDLKECLPSYVATPATEASGFPEVTPATVVMMLVFSISTISLLLSCGVFTWETIHVKPEFRRDAGFVSPWALYLVSVTGWSLIFMLLPLGWLLILLVLTGWLERKFYPMSTTTTASTDQEAPKEVTSNNESVSRKRSSLLGRFRSKGLPRHRQDTNEPDITKCLASNALPGAEERHRFLLLCIPFLKWGLKLQQPDVCRIHSDRDFFKLLRKAYLEHRVGKHWRWLRRVKQLDFCQVCYTHTSLARQLIVAVRALPRQSR